ncbi:MAG TPA: hypothetical protein VI389_04905 [Geobacteraceae bacterium]
MKKTTLYFAWCSLAMTGRAYANDGGGTQSLAVLLFITVIVVILASLAYREFVAWRSRTSKKSIIIDETKAMLDKLNNEAKLKAAPGPNTCPKCNRSYAEFVLHCEECRVKLVASEAS